MLKFIICNYFEIIFNDILFIWCREVNYSLKVVFIISLGQKYCLSIKSDYERRKSVMKILNALVKIAKKIMHAIAGMFKDKTPSEVINEVAKTATAVTTTGLIAYAGINSIRVHLMSSKKKNKNSSERKTGPELLREGRENSGSVEERFAEVKRSTANLLNKKSSSISKEDQEILKSIAKTRNIFFQNLSVPIQFPITVRNENPCICPAHRAIHGIHVKITATLRCNMRQTAVLSLPVHHIPFVFSGKGCIIK